MTASRGRLLLLALVVLIAAFGFYAWREFGGSGLPEGIASGNGRIEAVEIDVSTKAAGRVREILVREGDFVEAGQVLARMDTAQLEARKREAEAQLQRATIAVGTARSLVQQREAERTAAVAVVAQRQAELDAAARRLARSERLVTSNTVSVQTLDDNRAAHEGARAAVGAAQAQLAAADAAISAAKAQVVDAEASVEAAKASIESIDADIKDSTLVAPRPGRIQYRIAEPGEVLAAGGRVLNLVDLGDVYMTFFLPTEQAGKVEMGTDVRLVLDAAPQYVIPAKVSFVADVAQFTPKTVETAEERQKLMFRIRAQIPPELLERHIRQVKTGLPGMAYVRIDPQAEWPAELRGTLVQ
ncbi:HlyD family secretion protein [Roseomonas marmotae]|uniref:HlyD family efflux transporter periplasmic adaptor subunit n=1 Tax=Roseomonas marmotae TaxID=2768161 RepID=A0ABS3KB47_9PROT|nr:HlyD family efflux transporter periplasmic adaptor subunit [Roseomonas marmotae]MBO1074694.1 HlyD family efflux transporter periplasmic adaptor subunit [Roseomonas marmotae]QTI81711.1 HlyD family efflux transporter periplasmic adaptor subunit [Roseomonas marmotae]